MSWEKKLAFAGAIPIFLALASFLDLLAYRSFFKYPFMTPGQIAFVLVPWGRTPSLASLGWEIITEFLLDLAWWGVVILIAVALILRRKVLLQRLTVPAALALALVCEGFALRGWGLTPGLELPRAWYLGLTTYHPVPSILALAIDTACWLGIFLVAYKFVPQVRGIVE